MKRKGGKRYLNPQRERVLTEKPHLLEELPHRRMIICKSMMKKESAFLPNTFSGGGGKGHQ